MLDREVVGLGRCWTGEMVGQGAIVTAYSGRVGAGVVMCQRNFVKKKLNREVRV
ncbi:hypothetical protein B0H19DRAFT_1155091 [Mycena capillaripes]|nr:hypothetical protein B0H19DRAFT_1155091 [Mycena capillaripes]